MLLHCCRLMVAGGILLSTIGALADEARDFCYKDDGAICKISDELQQECLNVEGKKFRQCTCESGYLRAQQACEYCLAATGDTLFPDITEDQIDQCEKGGFSVAPIPTSYISEIKERNKTATLPKIASTSSSWSGILFTTPLLDPGKGTITGMPTVNLPTLIPPTAPVESMGGKARTMESQTFKYLFKTAFMFCVVFAA